MRPLPLDEAAHEVEVQLLRLPQVRLLVLAGGGAELAASVGERARLAAVAAAAVAAVRRGLGRALLRQMALHLVPGHGRHRAARFGGTPGREYVNKNQCYFLLCASQCVPVMVRFLIFLSLIMPICCSTEMLAVWEI